MTVDSDSAHRLIDKHPFLLVVFDAKWCQQSHTAVKAIHSLAKGKSEEIKDLGVILAVVTGMDNREDLRKVYDIEEYPHVSAFVQGAQVKYDGLEYTPDGYLEFLKRKAQTFTHSAEKVEEIEDRLNERDHLVLYFGSRDHARYKFFVEASHKFDGMLFLHASTPEIQERYSLVRDNLYILKKGGHREQFRKAWKRDRILNWIYLNTYPRIKTMDEDLLSKILDDQSPSLVLFLPNDNPDKDEETADLIPFFTKHADLFYESYYFGICPLSSPECTRLIQSVPLFTPDRPGLYLLTHHPSHPTPIPFKYSEEEISRDRLHGWLQGIRRGDVHMVTHSEEKSHGEGIEKITWMDIHSSLGSDKDMLIVFIDNQSRHGQMFNTAKGRMDKVKDKMEEKGDKHVRFGYFDVDKNSVYGLNIDRNSIPFVRYYKRYESGQYTQVPLKDVQTVEQIVNLILDVSSDSIHYIPEYAQEDI